MSRQNHRGRFYKPIDVTNLIDDDQHHFKEFEPFDGAEATPRGFPGGSSLSVVDIDLCVSLNSGPHKTWMYNSPNLVLRRGDPFVFKITFNRALTQQDRFQVEFRIGANPSVVKGSLIILTFQGFDQDFGGPWAAYADQQDRIVTVVVTPAVDAVVGRYRLVVGVALSNGLQYTPDLKNQLYLLFNAWNPKDVVFLQNQSDCGEYVLNDSGVIYMGEATAVAERSWNYGQFEAGVLDACIYIMDRSKMPISSRGDAVKVVRMASAMINSQDDDGVLTGNWSNDFSMGVAPTLWTGSVPILLKYASTQVPVNYAQCWVYAGVFNTFLRCLGMASRVITNFCSAHDNDGNLKTDLIFTSDLQPDTRNTRDSIWNYHCWNEVFLSRNDIPVEFSGWQVVDATPQETSDGYYRCGPSSVGAIKEGLLCHPFDGRFIFAEVNSDVVYYQRDKYGNLKQFQVDKTLIGKLILTKAPNRNARMDVTGTYKYPEGSIQNENAKTTAEMYGCERDHSEIQEAPLTVTITAGEVFVGGTVEVSVDFVNTSVGPLTADVHLSVETVYYTGVSSHEVKKEDFSVDLSTSHTQRMVLSVPPQDYLEHLGSQPSLQFTISAKTSQNQTVISRKVLSLEVLKLTLEVSDPVLVGQEASVTVSFTNVLKLALIQPRLVLEGSGLIEQRIQDFKNLEPGAKLKWTQTFTPRLEGTRTLSAVLVCTNLFQAWGSAEVTVQSAGS